MQLFKTPHIQFMKYKYIALSVTALIVLAGALNIIFGKGLKLGVDFGEGTLIRVMLKNRVSVGDIRSELKTLKSSRPAYDGNLANRNRNR